MNPLDNVFLALDHMDKKTAEELLSFKKYSIKKVKVGLELFYRYGSDWIRKIHGEYGVSIFLDLKLHDIPETVVGSIRSLRELPISFLSIHLSSGTKALKRSLEETPSHITLLGVSHLTSLDESDLQKVWDVDSSTIKQSYTGLFNLGIEAGLSGMVLSGAELPLLKKLEQKSSTSLIKVCPGIRFPDEITAGNIQDQKKVFSPSEAITNGADYLVIGRSLTSAKDFSARIDQLKSLL